MDYVMKVVSKNSVVCRSNAFIEAIIKALSAVEFKIIIHLTASIEVSQTPEQFATTWFSINVKEFCEVCDLPLGGSQYRSLKQAAEKLLRRQFRFPSEGGWEQVGGWITNYKYHKTDGRIAVLFNPEIKPYMFDLEQYTKYKIGDFAKLKSVYSLRLYEMILRWDGSKKRRDSLDELREKLCDNDAYLDMVTFRRNVIDLAIKEINEKTKMKVRHTYKKTGRQFTHVEFSILETAIVVSKPKPLTDKEVEEYIVDQKSKGIEVASVGESRKEAFKRLKLDHVKEVRAFLRQKLKQDIEDAKGDI